MGSNRKQHQLPLAGKEFKKERSEHGGDLLHVRKRKRPLGVRSTMHIVLRSSKAINNWSFKAFEGEIHHLLVKFAQKNHIQILSVANVGNHLHLHIRVRGRTFFKAFIRAITAAIMMKVTGYNRWNPSPEGFYFWDTRPFTRIVSSWREFINLKAYIEVNQWEALGYKKNVARYLRRVGILSAGSG